MSKTIVQGRKLSTVELNWKEVYYTNCGLVSASNVDQELGWTREDYKKIGVKYCVLTLRRARTTGTRTTSTTSTTSSASAGCSRPSRFRRTSAGPGCWA